MVKKSSGRASLCEGLGTEHIGETSLSVPAYQENPDTHIRIKKRIEGEENPLALVFWFANLRLQLFGFAVIETKGS